MHEITGKKFGETPLEVPNNCTKRLSAGTHEYHYGHIGPHSTLKVEGELKLVNFQLGNDVCIRVSANDESMGGTLSLLQHSTPIPAIFSFQADRQLYLNNSWIQNVPIVGEEIPSTKREFIAPVIEAEGLRFEKQSRGHVSFLASPYSAENSLILQDSSLRIGHVHKQVSVAGFEAVFAKRISDTTLVSSTVKARIIEQTSIAAREIHADVLQHRVEFAPNFQPAYNLSTVREYAARDASEAEPWASLERPNKPALRVELRRLVSVQDANGEERPPVLKMLQGTLTIHEVIARGSIILGDDLIVHIHCPLNDKTQIKAREIHLKEPPAYNREQLMKKGISLDGKIYCQGYRWEQLEIRTDPGRAY